jgi:hypothetical protein
MSSLTVPIPPNLSPACRAGNTDLETDPAMVLDQAQIEIFGDELVDGMEVWRALEHPTSLGAA